MSMKRVMAGAAAAAMAAVGLVAATSSPASATDCKWHLEHEGKLPAWCKTTTTEKKTTTTAKATTTTAKPGATTTTTTALKGEVVRPKPPAVVKVTPKFTG